jgi:hypothetical protein
VSGIRMLFSQITLLIERCSAVLLLERMSRDMVRELCCGVLGYRKFLLYAVMSKGG